ncbi:hypothetical protein BSL78_06836 [Apostichopus japonicus]|uniref:Uncharacterized protein n=1 Tax=Stichopus japonicus TaxID=307972 RepID=A0A2G8L7L5_STIJA|nr:hypothetical protein BSL78_06836 [Apostichopus japonicus]
MCINPCVYSTYATKETTVAIGQNAIFACGQKQGCPSYVWRIYSQNRGAISVSEGATNTVFNVNHDTTPSGSNILRVNSINENSPIFYQCLCTYRTTEPTAFACQQLIVITFCQVQVLVESRLETFNASIDGPTELSLFSVTEGEHVAVTCPGTSTFKTNCSNIGSSNFTISRSQQNCLIECLYGEICTAGVIVNVLHRDDTTTIASTDYSVAVTYNSTSSVTYRDTSTDSGSYLPFLVGLLLAALTVLIIVVVVCVYIGYYKSNRKTKSIPRDNSTNPASIETAIPTYASVDKVHHVDLTPENNIFELDEPAVCVAKEGYTEHSVVNSTSPGRESETLTKVTNADPETCATANDLKSILSATNGSSTEKEEGDTEKEDSKFANIPVYAEVNKPTARDEDVSALYASVNKTR